MGYDVRKLKEDGLDGFVKLWETCGGITEVQKRNNPEDIENGAVIGVKLYPPIGFNPRGDAADDNSADPLCLDLYAWLAHHQIPITVHCQSQKGGSFSTQKGLVDQRTTPKNWQTILKMGKHVCTSGPLQGQTVDLGTLRINFAHFAGEVDMDDMIDWKQVFSGGIDKSTWAWTIIELLGEHPNTYSDIAAFDFSPWRILGVNAYNGTVNALVGLLDRDKAGTLPNIAQGRISERILWGSDIPMIISGDWLREEFSIENQSHYRNLREYFKRAVTSCRQYKGNHDSLIDKITCRNACKFLFP